MVPAMTVFSILELSETILGFFETPAQLTSLARVNRALCAIVQTALYSEISFKDCKSGLHFLQSESELIADTEARTERASDRLLTMPYTRSRGSFEL